jgi:hypothetical protein
MKSLTLVAMIGALAVTAQAGPIVQYVDGPFSYASFFTAGESFTTPGGGPWNSLSFNLYSNSGPATTPVGTGTAFLLSMEYAGTPAALNNATPGFIDSSISNAGGIFTFNSGVTLQPNTQYWIFLNSSGFRFTGSTTAGTSGQSLYIANGGAFVLASGQVANFTLSGTQTVPEPSTWWLTGVVLCIIVLFAGRTHYGNPWRTKATS